MKFKAMEKILPGRFISRYNLTYETTDGREKVYEIISRNPALEHFEELHDHPPEAVVLILHDESGEKLLLNREYRMALGCEIYNFPAGLIDPGEEPAESARRELWEETGLKLLRVDDWLYESYGAVGFSNEKTVTAVGVATGDFSPSTDTMEEIHAGWYTKAEVRELLHRRAPFAARTQAYCYLWSRTAGAAPEDV